MRRRTGLAVAAGAAVLAWGEWMNWRWSRALVGDREGTAEAVVVLGYRNPQKSANAVNRQRVRAGIRSVAADRVPSTRVALFTRTNSRCSPLREAVQGVQ
ncbi:hypothetical protein [Streptomyces sp. NPDC001621]|uniref:hypothetical protein n=1 Tax=Streptomyces sp. NPDC001621 TaxID=3364594 RepID=UPI0036AE3BC3